MVELSVNYFDELPTLIHDRVIDFEYVRLGNWFDPETVGDIVAGLPGRRFLYHYNRNLRADEAKTRTIIDTLQKCQRYTDSPWLSAHLDQHTDEEIFDLLKHKRRPPRYTAEQAFDMICGAVKTVQAHLPVPLLLENVPHWPLPELDIAITPGFIRRVLDETGCGFLLDTAHAKITAHRLNCGLQSYLEDLPLKCVVEIHVAGTDFRDGEMVDSHEPLQTKDYAVLEWLLGRTTPKVITLEYSKDPKAVPEQVTRLNQLISRANAA